MRRNCGNREGLWKSGETRSPCAARRVRKPFGRRLNQALQHRRGSLAVTGVTDCWSKRRVTSSTNMLNSPGEHVCITGAYEVLHQTHRLPHDVWLWADEKFPRCRQCGSAVIFKFVRRATEPTCDHAKADEDFADGVSAA